MSDDTCMTIIDNPDGSISFVPADPANGDRQTLQAWSEATGEPVPERIDAETLAAGLPVADPVE